MSIAVAKKDEVMPMPPKAGGCGWRALLDGRRSSLLAGLWRGLLGLLSLAYALAVFLRNRWFDWGWGKTVRVDVPVVSVGNLTVGGTGKTPTVEYIVRFYCAGGRRPAILSRGYGSRHALHADASPVNDEAWLLAENLPDVPHLQGADRVALARRAVAKSGCDVLVLDDGFQHRRLARDLDIVVIDASAPWGLGRLLPRGLLREPVSSLRRADLVLLTRCDQVERSAFSAIRSEVRRWNPKVPIVESVHYPVALVSANGCEQLPEALKDVPVLAFCGVGNPEAFWATLRAVGARIVAWKEFPDHHDYPASDLRQLVSWAAGAPEAVVVTTQKDLVKLRRTELRGLPLWGLRVALKPGRGREVLDRMLRRVLE